MQVSIILAVVVADVVRWLVSAYFVAGKNFFILNNPEISRR